MTYSVEKPKTILIIMILMLPTLAFTNKIIYFSAVFILLIISLLRSYLTIHPEHLEYRMTIFKFTIYRIVLNQNNIKKIQFGRIGWSTKNAVIKVKGSLSISMPQSNKEEFVLELEQFAINHGIKVQKTKDYKLLEKYYSHN
ncbi:hypothetical protein LC048_16945 [Mesobacillus subterraneus]|uniref:hypothetical protein n=1 Tax=Mesobacillus subterraneus TaxID=285983 RepID=UPI001CFDA28E|nr:hypothetical protein [Mesobacillus subterraneus]WLR54136.1 hypothetical protein LC048_16945 [Mesobacillus subterraneus]